MDSLTPTGCTVLGYLASHPRSGYDIRRAAGRTVFWGISDGQLYPQLRQLAERGLIEPDDADTAGAPHGKRVWRITDAGRAALAGWLAAPSAPVAIRDENLVKLLFAARTDRAAARKLIEERRRQFERFRAEVEAITPADTWTEAERADAAGVPSLVREYGLAYSETALDWCARVAGALGAAETDGAVPAAGAEDAETVANAEITPKAESAGNTPIAQTTPNTETTETSETAKDAR